MQGPPPVADPRHRPHQLARRRTSAPRALLSYIFRANAPPPRRSRPLLSWACAAALAVPAHQRAPPCKPSTPSIWGGLRSRLSIVGPRAGAPLEVAPPPLRFLAGSAASPKRRPACAPRHPTFWPARRRFREGSHSPLARSARSRLVLASYIEAGQGVRGWVESGGGEYGLGVGLARCRIPFYI